MAVTDGRYAKMAVTDGRYAKMAVRDGRYVHKRPRSHRPLCIRVRGEASAPSALLVAAHVLDRAVGLEHAAHRGFGGLVVGEHHDLAVEARRARGHGAVAHHHRAEYRSVHVGHHLKCRRDHLGVALGVRFLRQAGKVPKDGAHVRAQLALQEAAHGAQILARRVGVVGRDPAVS